MASSLRDGSRKCCSILQLLILSGFSMKMLQCLKRMKVIGKLLPRWMHGSIVIFFAEITSSMA
ncbi:hypothetical protein ACSBR2_006189 [Camellia fascicularis]